MLNQKVFIIERTENTTTLTMKFNQYTFTPNRDELAAHLDCRNFEIATFTDSWTCHKHNLYYDERDMYDFEAVEAEYVLHDPNYGPNKGD